MATYTGVLTGDRIEWTNGAKPPDGPVRVEVVEPPAPEMSLEERRRRLREAFEAMDARGTFDPEAWERGRAEARERSNGDT